MKFAITRGLSFEVPDEWLDSAGVDGFTPESPTYNWNACIEPRTKDWEFAQVALSQIVPPVRNLEGCPHGLLREKMIPILKGMVAGDQLPAVEVAKLQPTDDFRYRVRDGYHRFYASWVMRFEFLPVVIFPYLDDGTTLGWLKGFDSGT